MKIKRIWGVLFLLLFINGNAWVYANNDIQCNIDRTTFQTVNYCAYNGINYVMVGNKGLISVSSDLVTWNEVKGVCYTDIKKIIWDGINFVFLSEYNVYKSPDGYSWTKSSCDFTYTSDFALAGDKFIVHKSTERNARGVAYAPVGLTSDFINFEEINFETALENVKLTYQFAPLLYYIDGIYFAKGLLSEIVWSTDLVQWFKLPQLPNENISNKEELLFTDNADEILIYYYENSVFNCYSLLKSELETATEWRKTSIDVNLRWSSVDMQKMGNDIYLYGLYDNFYKSNDSYNFGLMNDISTNDVYFIQGNDIILKIDKNRSTTYAHKNEKCIVGYNIQNPVLFESGLIWTGKEYIKKSDGIVYTTTDRQNLISTDIDLEKYTKFFRLGEKEILWDGSRYVARISGYEAPKLRGGALEDGKKLFVFDEALNLLDEIIFDGDVCGLSFVNGKYYVKIGDLADNDKYYVYSSPNLKKWDLEEGLSEVPVSNGQSEVLFNFNRTGSASYTGRDKIIQSNIKLGNRRFSEIDYETDSLNYSAVIDGIYVSKMITENGVYIGFSDDGVYYNKVKLPEDYLILLDRGTTTKEPIFYDLGTSIAYEEYGVIVQYDKEQIKASFSQPEHTYVKVSDKILGFDIEPVIESDRTLVPLRFIFETLGADVNWEDATRTAVVQNEEATIRFSIDNTMASVNRVNKTMDVPARLVNGKTMVPLRFLSEELGFTVEWDEEARLATILP